MYLFIYTHICVHMHICAYIKQNTYIYIYIYIHVDMCINVCGGGRLDEHRAGPGHLRVLLQGTYVKLS